MIANNTDKLKDLISLYSSSVEENDGYFNSVCDSDSISTYSDDSTDSQVPTMPKRNIFDDESCSQRSTSLPLFTTSTTSSINSVNDGLNINAKPYIPSAYLLFNIAVRQSQMQFQ